MQQHYQPLPPLNNSQNASSFQQFYQQHQQQQQQAWPSVSSAARDHGASAFIKQEDSDGQHHSGAATAAWAQHYSRYYAGGNSLGVPASSPDPRFLSASAPATTHTFNSAAAAAGGAHRGGAKGLAKGGGRGLDLLAAATEALVEEREDLDDDEEDEEDEDEEEEEDERDEFSDEDDVDFEGEGRVKYEDDGDDMMQMDGIEESTSMAHTPSAQSYATATTTRPRSSSRTSPWASTKKGRRPLLSSSAPGRNLAFSHRRTSQSSHNAWRASSRAASNSIAAGSSFASFSPMANSLPIPMSQHPAHNFTQGGTPSGSRPRRKSATPAMSASSPAGGSASLPHASGNLSSSAGAGGRTPSGSLKRTEIPAVADDPSVRPYGCCYPACVARAEARRAEVMAAQGIAPTADTSAAQGTASSRSNAPKLQRSASTSAALAVSASERVGSVAMSVSSSESSLSSHHGAGGHGGGTGGLSASGELHRFDPASSSSPAGRFAALESSSIATTLSSGESEDHHHQQHLSGPAARKLAAQAPRTVVTDDNVLDDLDADAFDDEDDLAAGDDMEAEEDLISEGLGMTGVGRPASAAGRKRGASLSSVSTAQRTAPGQQQGGQHLQPSSASTSQTLLSVSLPSRAAPSAAQQSFAFFDEETCFRTIKELREHWGRHKKSGDNAVITPFRCAINGCGKTFKSLAGLRWHFQNAASNGHFYISFEDGGEQPSRKFKATVDALSKEKREVCPMPGCSKAFKQAAGLAYHLAHANTANHVVTEEMLDSFVPTLASKVRWWFAKKKREQEEKSAASAASALVNGPA